VIFTEEDARQFLVTYIFAASLFFITGIILTLVKERVLPRPSGRRWRRCVYGHWAAKGEYCSECGLYLAPVPEAQQKRIEYVAGHQGVRRAMGAIAMRYHFALWLVDLEQQDGREYMVDMALTLYRFSWRFLARETVEESE
jgi:hypothetical protein